MRDVHGYLVTHDRAEIEDLETACRPDADTVLQRLVGHEGVMEAFVLQTCNRAEFYASGENAREALKELEGWLDVREDLGKYVDYTESARHLMRLACGLESMIIGEDEVLGQVRDAYHRALEMDALRENGALGKVVLKSVHVAERARTETAINEGNASMGSAAVRLVEDRLDGVGGLEVVVVGAGEMGELVAKSFAARGAEIKVTNRTFGRADHLSSDIGGSPVKFSELSSHLDSADVLVSATSAPHLIFDGSDLAGHGLLVLDLANPRDVGSSAGDVEDVELLDIDDVASVSDSTVDARRRAAGEVEEIIEREMEVLEEQFKEERAMEMLSKIYERAEEIRVEETREALRRLEGLSEEDEEVVHDLTRSIVNKLLSTPTEALKNAAVSEDYETLRSASDIFRLSDEEKEELRAELD